jgi:hypothetical protein
VKLRASLMNCCEPIRIGHYPFGSGAYIARDVGNFALQRAQPLVELAEWLTARDRGDG